MSKKETVGQTMTRGALLSIGALATFGVAWLIWQQAKGPIKHIEAKEDCRAAVANMPNHSGQMTWLDLSMVPGCGVYVEEHTRQIEKKGLQNLNRSESESQVLKLNQSSSGNATSFGGQNQPYQSVGKTAESTSALSGPGFSGKLGSARNPMAADLRRCWRSGTAAPGVSKFSVLLQVVTDATGVVREVQVAPTDRSRMENPMFAALAQRTIDAAKNYRCAKLPLPANMLGSVHTFTFRFTP